MNIIISVTKDFPRIASPEFKTILHEIGEAADVFPINGTHEISVQMTSGVVESSVEELIRADIYYTSGMTSMGKAIVEFKQRVIGIFSHHGVLLKVKDVEVRMNPADTPTDRMNNRTVFSQSQEDDEFDYHKKAQQFVPVEPLYSFDRVVLPRETIEKITDAIGILQCENKVFHQWGLYEIQPHPSTSLSFYGPSGTGKTMAAEAVAQKLGKKILKVSYADVESKYHGEGPKMVKAIFLAAEKADAVLFFDEADSLLSKRLTNVSHGSEQAINSMRSQLLICLEDYRGIVIFATNLVINYDSAFLTRLISIDFQLPNCETRQRIWEVHLRAPNDGQPHQLNIPLGDDVDMAALAESYEFVGREIRNAVVSACVSVAMAGREIVGQDDLKGACEKIIKEKVALHDVVQQRDMSALVKNAIEKKMAISGEVESNVPEHAD